ncbi:MAG: metallophosphoesterase family protein [Chloroflexi bacterium]|nr:metallophosphoesterase family protein [Chloroflexota bacterium]
MRVALISDIHGNLPALASVLADLSQRRVDRIIVAGDLVGHGPFPNEVVRTIRTIDPQPVVIKGNTDQRALDLEAGRLAHHWYTARQFAAARWTNQQLDASSLAYLASLPDQLVSSFDDADPIRVVHGSPRAIDDIIRLPRDDQKLIEILEEVGENVLACAHTHRPFSVRLGEKLVVNGGALLATHNGDWRATYATLEWRHDRWNAEHHAVPYDLERLRQAYEARGLFAADPHFGRAVWLSIESGIDMLGPFIRHALELAHQIGYKTEETIPDHVYEEAGISWHWSVDQVREADKIEQSTVLSDE